MVTTLVLGLFLAAEPFTPAGLELHLSECASGGFDWFFFRSGAVISKCWGCERQPWVQRGTWKMEGDTVQVRLEREWYGQGVGREIEHASVTVYEEYEAVGPLSQEKLAFPIGRFTQQPTCGRAQPHQRAEDPHAFLRTFAGAWRQTAERELKASELAGQRRGALRLMRNEIYARYGLRFRDADLTAHFKKQKGYRPSLRDVEAFLTEVEQKNAATIAEAEKKAAP
jgi:YARHG domain